jgi:hypothetical protein
MRDARLARLLSDEVLARAAGATQSSPAWAICSALARMGEWRDDGNRGSGVEGSGSTQQPYPGGRGRPETKSESRGRASSRR